MVLTSVDDGKEAMEERILAVDLVQEDDDGDVGEELRDDRQKRHFDVGTVTSVTLPENVLTDDAIGGALHVLGEDVLEGCLG